MKRAVVLRALLVIVLAVMVLPIRPAPVQAAPVFVDRSAAYVPGEVVVNLPDGLSAKEYQSRAQALATGMNAQVVARYGSIVVLSADPNADVPALVQSLAVSQPQVRAQPNYIYAIPENGRVSGRKIPTTALYDFKDQRGRTRTFTASQLAGMRTQVRRSGRKLSVPAFPSEYTSGRFQTWGWEEVAANLVWNISAASPAVCEIDTGVDAAHPDLKGAVINGPDFINNDNVPNDDNGHGTHVAGIIAAKMNNGSGTALGVSNGKVVAVKALNAQGFGTTASISAALRYCANQTAVRVINMSLGSDTKDLIQYNSLYYAIVTKNKLVVTAAGNSGSANPSYPAAYTSATITAPDDSPNAIHSGIISVTAGSSNPASIRIWVDLNNNGKSDDVYTDANGNQYGEFFDGADCATEFSNFGPYVDLVAPGDMVYSTQPVSYTFFNQYYYGYQSKYDYYSGSSMAAPYVSAAAVRMLSVFPTLPAYAANESTVVTMKKRLVDTGRSLTYAVVPNGGGGAVTTSNPANPFPSNPDPNSFYFGKITYPEPDSQSLPVLEMPYCWPSSTATVQAGSNPYGAAEDMSHARFLDVSSAMGRIALYAEASDASTGLPLTGATITAIRPNGTIVDTAIVGKNDAGVFLFNFPVPDTQSVQYTLWVNKPGYTSGNQLLDWPQLNSSEVDPNAPQGGLIIGYYSAISIPPNKDISVVLNWDRLSITNLDLYLWLPENATSSNGSIKGVVNPGALLDYLPNYPPNLDLQQGSLQDASIYNPDGVSPFAQLMHDGGDPYKAQDGLQFDAIRIARQPGVTKLLPYYTGTGIKPYDIYVTDYTGNYGGKASVQETKHALSPNSPEFAYPIVRVWEGGRLMNWATVYTPDMTVNPSCQVTTNDWWFAMRLLGTSITAVDQCGTAGAGTDTSHGILPYPQAATP